MNFIKTSKFSVKGIDTTRYIPRAFREESPPFSKGKNDSHAQSSRAKREISSVNSFWVEFEEGFALLYLLSCRTK